jgi:hypothetical protein
MNGLTLAVRSEAGNMVGGRELRRSTTSAETLHYKPTSHGLLMLLLWLLCVGLVLGGLLASLAREVPWARLHLRRALPAPVRMAAPPQQAPRRAKRRRGRTLAPPATGTRAGPPGFPDGIG